MTAVVYLYLLIARGDGSVVIHKAPHPSYLSCFAALKQARIVVPSGDENEVAITAMCATKIEFGK